MGIEELKENIGQMHEIVKELYIFTNQMEIIKKLELRGGVLINNEEKRLLEEIIDSLKNQLRILNSSIPNLASGIGFFKKLDEKKSDPLPKEKLVKIEFIPFQAKEKVTLTITDNDKKEFLENLSKSNLSINKLKKKYSPERTYNFDAGKPNLYAKISNHFFRDLSNKFVSNGYFNKLNKDLRMMNSPFVLGSYVSMLFFTIFLSFIISVIIFVFLLFFDISLTTFEIKDIAAGDSIILRAVKFAWIIIILPAIVGLVMYVYPSTESSSYGKKIDQELPFVAIHMSAIATSGVEPISIFKIILKSEEYKYSNVEFRKIINLINFHGKDLVTALRETSSSCPSGKLKVMLDGISTTITSGGDLHEYLDKHSESLLFDYKLEREKNTKTSETFMDIYISIAIAAPMIFLMLFVIMGSTGSFIGTLGLSVDTLSVMLIMGIVGINIVFLMFLRMQQPAM